MSRTKQCARRGRGRGKKSSSILRETSHSTPTSSSQCATARTIPAEPQPQAPSPVTNNSSWREAASAAVNLRQKPEPVLFPGSVPLPLPAAKPYSRAQGAPVVSPGTRTDVLGQRQRIASLGQKKNVELKPTAFASASARCLGPRPLLGVSESEQQGSCPPQEKALHPPVKPDPHPRPSVLSGSVICARNSELHPAVKREPQPHPSAMPARNSKMSPPVKPESQAQPGAMLEPVFRAPGLSGSSSLIAPPQQPRNDVTTQRESALYAPRQIKLETGNEPDEDMLPVQLPRDSRPNAVSHLKESAEATFVEQRVAQPAVIAPNHVQISQWDGTTNQMQPTVQLSVSLVLPNQLQQTSHVRQFSVPLQLQPGVNLQVQSATLPQHLQSIGVGQITNNCENTALPGRSSPSGAGLSFDCTRSLPQNSNREAATEPLKPRKDMAAMQMPVKTEQTEPGDVDSRPSIQSQKRHSNLNPQTQASNLSVASSELPCTASKASAVSTLKRSPTQTSAGRASRDASLSRPMPYESKESTVYRSFSERWDKGQTWKPHPSTLKATASGSTNVETTLTPAPNPTAEFTNAHEAEMRTSTPRATSIFRPRAEIQHQSLSDSRNVLRRSKSVPTSQCLSLPSTESPHVIDLIQDDGDDVVDEEDYSEHKNEHYSDRGHDKAPPQEVRHSMPKSHDSASLTPAAAQRQNERSENVTQNTQGTYTESVKKKQKKKEEQGKQKKAEKEKAKKMDQEEETKRVGERRIQPGITSTLETEIVRQVIDYGLLIIERSSDTGKPTWLACKFCAVFGCPSRHPGYIHAHAAPFIHYYLRRHASEHTDVWPAYRHADKAGKVAFFQGKSLPDANVFKNLVSYLKTIWRLPEHANGRDESNRRSLIIGNVHGRDATSKNGKKQAGPDLVVGHKRQAVGHVHDKSDRHSKRRRNE